MPSKQTQKDGNDYSMPLDRKDSENDILFRKLSETEIKHIERHINNPSIRTFMSSVYRQRYRYSETKKPSCSGSVQLPCNTCLEIAKKLGV